MRAPLPSLADAIALPYPSIATDLAPAPHVIAGQQTQKTIRLDIDTRIDDPAAIAAMALDAARQGAKVLVIRNLQRDCVATARAVVTQAGEELNLLFRCNGIAAAHHGRYAREDRALLDAAVEFEHRQGAPARWTRRRRHSDS